MYTCNDKAFTFTSKVTDLIFKTNNVYYNYILCCILCCIWISLQHYYLYANYNAGGTQGLCHFLIIAFLMGDFLVYFFFQQHKQIEIFICCTQLNVICLPNWKIQR